MDCAVCQSSNETKSCSRCKTVYYCSVAHQKQHWSIHKPDCGLFRVVDSGDPTRGKYCVANRDIQAGEIILEEKAAFYSSWFSQPSTCVACGIYFSDGERKSSCSKCGCIVCGPACEKNSVHSQNECPLFARNKKLSKILKSFAVDSSMMFLMIRGAALKAKQPKIFKQIMQLQHTSTSEFFQKKMDSIVGKFSMGLKSAVGSGITEFDDDVCKRIGSVACMNVFRDARDEYTNDRKDGANKGKCCVYVRASRFNHSCIPNGSWFIGPEPECIIRIFAAVPISKGGEITICYPGVRTAFVTNTIYERQQLLQDHYGIHCKCPRCADPTELGTFSSALTCVACKNRLDKIGETDSTKYGYMVAENPLDGSDHAVWKCTICEEKRENLVVLEQIRNIGKELVSKFLTTNSGSLLGAAKSPVDMRLFEETMRKYRGHILHPNHIFITQIIAAISNVLCFQIVQGGAPLLSAIERDLGWINYSLALSDKLFPGLCSFRAHLLAIVAEMLRIKITNFHLNLTEEELTRDYNSYMRSAWESFQFYKLDFCCNGEKMSYQAKCILNNIGYMKAKWGHVILAEDDDVKDFPI